MMEFQDRLKGLIKSRKITATSFARSIGIKRQSVAQYLSGDVQPKADNIKKMSEFFGVSSDYLLGLTDGPTDDTTIQAICDETGLSDGFVSWLALHKDCAPKIEKLSKLMIENGFIGGGK